MTSWIDRRGEKARDMQQLYKTAHGKRVIDDLLFQFSRDSDFTSDPLAMARNVGQREVMHYVRTLLSWSNDNE